MMIRLSEVLSSLLSKENLSGEEMIALSRAVVSELQTSDVESEPYMLSFVSVEDQTDHIVLDGFGVYNKPSYREYVVYDGGTVYEGIGPPAALSASSPGYSEEIEDIKNDFGDIVLKAKGDLLRHLFS